MLEVNKEVSDHSVLYESESWLDLAVISVSQAPACDLLDLAE